MLNVENFRDFVVRPALKALSMRSPTAERLMLGTAVHESSLCYLKQIRGPALGLFQMEPATHDDVVTYLSYRPDLRFKVLEATGLADAEEMTADKLPSNLLYAALMARLLYWRDTKPLPDADDVQGIAGYYKRVWNTKEGAATVEGFIRNYREYVEPLYS